MEHSADAAPSAVHGFGTTARELAYLAVQILGVTYLLKNVTFLLIWFGVLWLMLRFGTHRRVNRILDRFKSSLGAADGLSLAAAVMAWLDDLLIPIASHRERIDSIVRRCDEIRADLRTRSAAAA